MDIIEEIEDLTTQARLSDDINEVKTLLDKSINLLVNNVEAIEDRSHYYYLLGYCWYLMPGGSDGKDHQIVENFKKAIELDSEHQFAILFLAHYIL